MVMTLKCIPIALLFVSIVAGANFEARQQTLPERAAANQGKPLTIPWMVEPLDLPFDELINGSELIVIARLTSGRSYLVGKDMAMATDYEVIPRQVIVDRAAKSLLTTPGQTPSLTLTLDGGELILNGVKVTLLDTSMDRWQQNADLLLFLSRRNDRQNGFYLHGGAGGAFQVDAEGRTRSLKSQGRKEAEVDGLELPLVVDKIRRRLK